MRPPRGLASSVRHLLLGACIVLPACALGDPDAPQASADDPITIGIIGDFGGVPKGGVLETPGDREFWVKGLGNRCFDFGGEGAWAVGAPVYLYGCNGSVAQRVGVREIDGSHDVELRVHGLYCIGARNNEVAVGRALELQLCNGSPAQR